MTEGDPLSPIPAPPDVVAAATLFLNACVERDIDAMLGASVEETEGSFAAFNTAGTDPQDRQTFAEHLRPLRKAGWAGLDPAGWVVGPVV